MLPCACEAFRYSPIQRRPLQRFRFPLKAPVLKAPALSFELWGRTSGILMALTTAVNSNGGIQNVLGRPDLSGFGIYRSDNSLTLWNLTGLRSLGQEVFFQEALHHDLYLPLVLLLTD